MDAWGHAEVTAKVAVKVVAQEHVKVYVLSVVSVSAAELVDLVVKICVLLVKAHALTHAVLHA